MNCLHYWELWMLSKKAWMAKQNGLFVSSDTERRSPCLHLDSINRSKCRRYSPWCGSFFIHKWGVIYTPWMGYTFTVRSTQFPPAFILPCQPLYVVKRWCSLVEDRLDFDYSQFNSYYGHQIIIDWRYWWKLLEILMRLSVQSWLHRWIVLEDGSYFLGPVNDITISWWLTNKLKQ